MKKTIFILVLTILVATTFTVATAVDVQEEKPLLSEMSESECISFVKKYGIELPAIYNDEAEWGPFVKSAIIKFENNPNAPIADGCTVSAMVLKEIRSAVNTYYGIPTVVVGGRTLDGESVSYEPVDSTVYANWDTSFEYYNCYAFALGKTDGWYDPGMIWAMRNNPSSLMNWYKDVADISIECLRDMVIADLEADGKTRITYEASSMDTSNLCTNESVICIRKGIDKYHCMKYTPHGWLHKPGNTQILKYNFVPNENQIWSNECVYMGNYYGADTYYDSTIYFISYNGHDWNLTSNSNGTHTKSCSVCGDSFTYSCNYSYSYIGLDTHSGRCLVCDGAAPNGACDITVTNNGNGTHTRACSLCDNHYTVNCSLEYTNINNTRHSATCTDCGYYVNSQLCTLTYTSRGNKTHTANCSQCKNTFTGNCSITYSYTSSNQHRGSCNKCSYTHTASCYYLTTYCGNSSLGDVHKKQCQTCGHISGSATTACSLIYKSNGNNTHSYQCTQCGYVKSGPTACMFKSDNTCKFCGAMKNSAVINDLEQEETA